MKHIHLLLVLFCLSTLSNAQTVFINELHYDNMGADENEGLEIAGPAGTDLSCYEIHLFNGKNSLVYDTVAQLVDTLKNESNGFGTHWLSVVIQNGDNDAIALYDACEDTVVQFISYEGEMTAIDGVAMNMTSVDIGVAQADAETEAGTSLQLVGSGMVYTDFNWTESSPSSYGSVNTNQTFGEAMAMPTFNVTPAELVINESADSVVYTLEATNLTDVHVVNIDIKEAATATLNEDYTIGNTEINVDAANGTNQTIDLVFYLINDEVEEETESTAFQISVEGENAIIANSSFTLIIEDDDAPPPPPTTYNVYTIADIHGEDVNGKADSLDVMCELTGIVYGINLRDNGLLFTINNGEGGISVFSGSNNFSYEVKEGDELKVQGKISQYNGLSQIEADTLWKVSEGNALVEPTDFFNVRLYEALESEYIKMNGLTMVDPTEWTTGEGNGGFNVTFTVPTLNDLPPLVDTIIVRIDDNTSLYSLPLEELTSGITENYEMLVWAITGIGGQFDRTEPYTSGFQLFPFDASDIEVVEGTSTPTYIAQNSIQVFPNPLTGNWLEVRAETLIKNLRIYNTFGKLINETNNSRINVKEMSSGFYLLEVETHKGKTLKKIIR